MHDKILGFSSRRGTPFLYVILFCDRRRVIAGTFIGCWASSPNLYGQNLALCHSSFGTLRPWRTQIEHTCRASFRFGPEADAQAYERVCVLPFVFEADLELTFRFRLCLPWVSFVRVGGGSSTPTLSSFQVLPKFPILRLQVLARVSASSQYPIEPWPVRNTIDGTCWRQIEPPLYPG